MPSTLRSLTTVDIVLDLPEPLHARALGLSALLVDRMRRAGRPSRFQLGRPILGDGATGECAPHVSLFMLAVSQPEIDAILAAVGSVAAISVPVDAIGYEYRHNPQGAPELYFQLSDQWRALQRAVVGAVEPLRRGRLREVDPAGDRLTELIDRLRREEPSGARLHQLLAYGYDEISDTAGERFNPHVTLAWPADRVPVDLADLPAAEEFSGRLTHLAVYGMSANGTCTTHYGGFPLAGARSWSVFEAARLAPSAAAGGDPDMRGRTDL